MDPKRLLGSVIVLVVAAVGVGVLGSLVTENVLFLSSDWQVAALVTTGFVALVVAVLIASAKPRSQWFSNPYW